MSLRFFLSLIVAVACFLPAGLRAQSFETKAPSAFMIDVDTGSVLYAKEPDRLIEPASLAKLMTMEIAFGMLKAGTHGLDDTFTVSEHAWRTGGAPSGSATMFAALKSSIRLEDLIQGVIVQGANDGCIIIAEGTTGSEDEYTKLMNERAKALGFRSMVFKNTSGLPAEGQVASVRELALLGVHIWRAYPEFTRYYAQPEFTWNKITQRNRNPLLAMGIGANGMGTGYTEKSGYHIVGSVSRNGRHIILAMGGLASERERAEEARKMLDWGIDAFAKRQLFEKTEVVGAAKLYGGAKSTVDLRADTPIAVLMPVETEEHLSARILYQGPVVAPVEAGKPVGTLRVWLGQQVIQETPLVAAESIGTGSLYQRALDAVEELAIGWLR